MLQCESDPDDEDISATQIKFAPPIALALLNLNWLLEELEYKNVWIRLGRPSANMSSSWAWTRAVAQG
jgi:hypothetical protein